MRLTTHEACDAAAIIRRYADKICEDAKSLEAEYRAQSSEGKLSANQESIIGALGGVGPRAAHAC